MPIPIVDHGILQPTSRLTAPSRDLAKGTDPRRDSSARLLGDRLPELEGRLLFPFDLLVPDPIGR